MCKQTEQDQLLATWQAASLELKELKDKEMKLRKEVLTSFFPDGKIGTNTMELGNDWKLKGVYKLNYKYDESVLDQVLEELRDEFSIATDDLVRIKKEPSMTAVKKLNDEQRLKLEEALITTPGTPSLELVEPKKKK